MRLTDVMSNLDLTLFPKVSLAIFFGVFMLVALRAWTMRRAECDHCASLVDDPPRADRR